MCILQEAKVNHQYWLASMSKTRLANKAATLYSEVAASHWESIEKRRLCSEKGVRWTRNHFLMKKSISNTLIRHGTRSLITMRTTVIFVLEQVRCLFATPCCIRLHGIGLVSLTT